MADEKLPDEKLPDEKLVELAHQMLDLARAGERDRYRGTSRRVSPST